MTNFITSRIEKAARISLADGKMMYRAYLVSIQTYDRWKTEIDDRLTADGFADVIVEV